MREAVIVSTARTPIGRAYARLAVVTMCIGGGVGAAAIFKIA